MNTALEAGWDAVGYDLNHGLVEAANRHWGFKACKAGRLEEIEEAFAGAFDAVLTNQVFEHFQRPLETGMKLVGLLKAGGVLYIEVPNVRRPREWFQRGATLDPTAHWCHFQTATMKAH